ncbi:MAG: DUF1778 domain-containing protein [Rhizobiaceae bacterium]|nr:DUF1778 domain-containing protein [Rhizobiaceae bacterium]
MSVIKKTKTITMRIDPEVMGLISRAAEIGGKSVTAFMTEASLYSAQQELLDQRFIGVTSDVFEAVESDLSGPGVARNQLVALFKNNFEWMD